MAVQGRRGNIFICCQHRFAAQHTAKAQLGTSRGTQPSLQLLGQRRFSCSWRVREGNVSLVSRWSKAKGVLFSLFQGLAEFYPLHISHCIGFFLSKGRVEFVFQVPWEECYSSKAHAGLWLMVRSQKMKTSTAFPAQAAPCSPSLFCLPFIKVKPLLRADMSV